MVAKSTMQITSFNGGARCCRTSPRRLPFPECSVLVSGYSRGQSNCRRGQSNCRSLQSKSSQVGRSTRKTQPALSASCLLFVVVRKHRKGLQWGLAETRCIPGVYTLLVLYEAVHTSRCSKGMMLLHIQVWVKWFGSEPARERRASSP